MPKTGTRKRLYRSNTDKILGGVCGGLSEFFGIDPTLVRLGWAVLTIFSVGIGGILLYLICWAIIPRGPKK